MALFRKFFYRKPPEGLLEISERVYVFDCCFTTDVLGEDEYKVYIGGIVSQLREHSPDASFMVFNFREGEHQSRIAEILSEYELTVMDYPRQYEGCPLLTMEMIHHFLRSSESWLSLGQQNVLLMHCERGGWPVLSFMLAGLLIYRKQYTGEQKTLDMIYKQAPRELLQLLSPLNPLPSQLRYLQYISRRNVGSRWPPLDRALTLDCVILRILPNFDGEGGCRPVFRIYGQDPVAESDRTPKVLYSTPKKSKNVRLYKQADCELVKIDIHCHIQGDVVVECIALDEDLEREEMMFRVMFNTAFIRSNILILNRDEIDILWDAKDRFPKDFRAEVLLSEMDATSSLVTVEMASADEKEGLPVEAFAKVQEIFSTLDWVDGKGDAALQVLQKLASSNAFQEKLDSVSPRKVEMDLPQKSSPDTLKEKVDGKGDATIQGFHKLTLSNVFQQKLDSVSTEKVEMHLPQISSPDMFEEKVMLAEAIDRVTTPSPSDSKKQPIPFQKQSPDSFTERPNVDHHDLQIALQRPSQSKIVSQRVPKSWSTPVSSVNSLQSSPKPFSRYNSAPSALGITALLQDHTLIVSSEVAHSVTMSASAPSLFAVASSGLSESVSTKIPSPSVSPAESKIVSSPVQSLHTPILSAVSSDMEAPITATSQPVGNTTVPISLPPPPPPPPIWPRSSVAQTAPPPTLMAPVRSASAALSPSPPQPLPPTSSLKKTSQSPQAPSTPEHSASKPFEPSVHVPSPPPPSPPSSSQGISSAALSLKLDTSSPVSRSQSLPSGGKSIPPPPPPPVSSSMPPPPPPPLVSLSIPPPLVSSSILHPTSPPLVSSSTPPPLVSSSIPPPPPPPRPLVSSSTPTPPPPPIKRSSAPSPPTPPSRSGPSSSPPSCSGPTSSGPPPPPPPQKPTSKHSGGSIPPSVPSPPFGHSPLKGSSAASSLSTSLGSKGPPPPPNGMNGPSSASLGVKGRNLSRTSSRHASQSSSKKTSLKPLHWVKVTRAMQGSLWAETQKPDEASKAPEFDMSELESLFSAAVPNSDRHGSADKSSGRPSLGQKPDKVHLIDLRRANNCEIMLTKVKMPLADLMSSVLALDDSVLDGDQVDNLIKFCPTKEEVELLKGFGGDKDSLGKCEQAAHAAAPVAATFAALRNYFLELMKVPRVESKLRVFSFKIQFRSQVADLSGNLNIVNNAAKEIRNSVKLKRIMQTILSLGNALNQGTARGSAVGFRLDSLLKLTDTRARNNKMTLMHYLCKVLADKLPELLDFSKDLVNLEAASKIMLKTLAEEMQAISKGLEKVEQELSASENDGAISDTFRKTLKEFLVGAEAEVRALTSLYSHVGRNADALALYFGEDPARCPFEQVMSTLLNFVKMFVRAHEENCKQLELEKKKAQKEAEHEKMKLGAQKREQENLVHSPRTR